jgi:hypothetical protein
MPLLDYFHPPHSRNRHWQGLHNAWASAIARQLNQVLPPRYFAEPHVQLGGRLEVGIGTFEERPQAGGGTATATRVWAPPAAAVDVPVSLGPLDEFAVHVINDEEGPRLVAAIELISPANKDRPEHRRAFAVKCAAYLQRQASLVMVDVVTTRQASLHGELLELLGAPNGPGGETASLYAAAYRLLVRREETRLQSWPARLEVGKVLPTLPLWLEPGFALPLDLDASYTAACEDLRIAVG